MAVMGLLLQALPATADAQTSSTAIERAPSSGAPSLLDASVDLQPGPKSASDTLLIKIPKTVPGVVPKLSESDPGGPRVTFAAPTVFGDPHAGEWLVRVTVANLPRDTTQKRRLQIAYRDTSTNVEYTVRNTGAAFSWSIQGPPTPIAWSGPGTLALTVFMGPQPATNLVARATLSNDRTNRPFTGGALQICANATSNPCSEVVTRLDADRPQTVYLLPIGNPQPGKYVGAVQVLASEAKADPIPLTVTVTSNLSKVLGGVTVVLSVAASYLVTIFVRNGLARAQLIRPAVALDEGFAALEGSLKRYKDLKQTSANIELWHRLLSGRSLEQQGYVPNRWAPTVPGAASAGYTAFLTKASGCLLAMQRLIEVGAPAVSEVVAALPDTSRTSDAGKLAIQDAWQGLDDLSLEMRPDVVQAPAVADVESAIAELLATLRQSAGAVQGRSMLDENLQDTPPSPAERLQFEISTLGIASWVVAALLTTVGGLLVLVVTRPDFGLFQDYLYCIMWCFGLPTATAQLAQQTPQSIASTINVSRPTAS